jgi:hypothetical protein
VRSLFPSAETREALGASLTRWFFFGIVPGCVALGVSAIHVGTRRNGDLTLDGLVGRGELLLISCAVLGGALTEMASQPTPRFPKMRLRAGLFAALVICAAIAAFVDVSGDVQDQQALIEGFPATAAALKEQQQNAADPHKVAQESYWIFGFAMATGFACVYLGALEEKLGVQAEEG